MCVHNLLQIYFSGHTCVWVLWAEALPDSSMLRVVMVTVLYCLSVVVGTDEKPAFSAEVCFMKGAWL